MQESMDTLDKDPACNKSKEHFNYCLKTLNQIQTEDIYILLETIISVREYYAKENKTNRDFRS